MQGFARRGVFGEATFPPRRLPMKKCVLGVLAAFALAAPTGALASGVVLKVQPARHLIAVARTPTSVQLVHTKAAPHLHVGQRVDMHARMLRNGTFAASKLVTRGRAHSVKFRGLLLSARPAGRAVLSAGGAVIVLEGHSPITAAPGSTVDVVATVGDHDDLDEAQMTVFSPTSPGGKIEGRLTIGTGTIAVTSEHSSLVIAVPTGFDLAGFVQGEEVIATFAQLPNGSLSLLKLSGDEDNEDADDQDRDRHGGDDHDHHGGGDDQGGHGR
jgi:hypothetical protein